MAHARLTVLNLPTLEGLSAHPPRRRILDPRGYSTLPCSVCPGHCCATATVEVTTVEALRMAFDQALALEAVVQRMGCAPDVADRWASVPIPLEDGLTVLRLRHRDKGGCTFLNAALEQGRCSAHATRPGTCRLYPLTIRAGTVTNTVGTDALCPLRWVGTPQLEQAAARDWRRWRADVAHEKRLVKAWVKAGGEKHPWKVFSTFASHWAQTRMGLRAPTAFFPR